MLRVFQFVADADDILERSWQQRNWSAFIRFWLLGTLCLTVVAFLAPFVFAYLPASIYNLLASIVTMIFGGTAKVVNLSLWDVASTLAIPFCVVVGLITLVFTVPVMLLKQLSGEFSPP